MNDKSDHKLTTDLAEFAGHTPGPWGCTGYTFPDDGEGGIYFRVKAENIDARYANARLIAAAPRLLAENAELRAEVERLRGALMNPPKHNYWGAGEVGCPAEIKAGNGELHTLRCKVCGNEDARSPICIGALAQWVQP